MAEQQPNPPGPDLTKGVSVADIAAGQMLLGHVNQDAVLLARQGDEFFAIGATCSHYSGPLAEGLMAGDTVRCPWHHARFSLRLLRSMHCRVGAWKRATTKYLYAKGRPRPIEASRPNQRGPRSSRIASSSWAAVPRDLLPPRCCGAKDLAAVSRSCPLTMSRPTTGRIAPRITWPEARRKTGCRSSRLSSTRNIQSTFSSAARLPQSTPGRGKWRWRTGGKSHLTNCFLQPAPSRSVCNFRARISRMSTFCARFPTRAPSSPTQRRRGTPLSSAQASSVWRLRPRCGRGTWMFTSSRRNAGRWSASSVRNSAISFENSTKSTASFSIWRIPSPQLKEQTQNSRVARHCQPTWLSLAWACGLGSNWPNAQASKLIAASLSTNTSRPAYRTYMPPETLRAGPTRIQVRTSGSSIGLWPSVRVRLLQEICLGKNSDFPKCLSFGASTMTCPSITSAMPKSGIVLISTATSSHATVWCAIDKTAKCWRSLRSSGILIVSRPRCRWRHDSSSLFYYHCANIGRLHERRFKRYPDDIGKGPARWHLLLMLYVVWDRLHFRRASPPRES